MAQTPKTIPELLAALEDRSFVSFKSRLRTYGRIQARNRAWNTALISLAAATTVAAVGLLVDDMMYGKSGETLLAASAVLSLAASLVVAALDYPGRAVRVETNYKEIQDISSRVQTARHAGGSPTIDTYNELYATYSELIRHSENHSEADHDAYQKKQSWSRFGSSCLTLVPYVTLFLPGWLLWKFAEWVVRGSV